MFSTGADITAHRAGEPCRQQNVVQSTEAGEKMKVLQDQTDIGAAPTVTTALGERADIDIAPEDAALSDPLEPGQDADQRAFAGS